MWCQYQAALIFSSSERSSSKRKNYFLTN
jgi:hypothetical protein